MAKSKVYIVTDKATKTPRLVRATSRGMARGYVARSSYATSLASQNVLISLVQAGVKVEDAALAPPESDNDDEAQDEHASA